MDDGSILRLGDESDLVDEGPHEVDPTASLSGHMGLCITRSGMVESPTGIHHAYLAAAVVELDGDVVFLLCSLRMLEHVRTGLGEGKLDVTRARVLDPHSDERVVADMSHERNAELVPR